MTFDNHPSHPHIALKTTSHGLKWSCFFKIGLLISALCLPDLIFFRIETLAGWRTFQYHWATALRIQVDSQSNHCRRWSWKKISFENNKDNQGNQDNQDNQDKTIPNSQGCQPVSMAIYKAVQPPLPRVHLVILYINFFWGRSQSILFQTKARHKDHDATEAKPWRKESCEARQDEKDWDWKEPCEAERDIRENLTSSLRSQ